MSPMSGSYARDVVDRILSDRTAFPYVTGQALLHSANPVLGLRGPSTPIGWQIQLHDRHGSRPFSSTSCSHTRSGHFGRLQRWGSLSPLLSLPGRAHLSGLGTCRAISGRRMGDCCGSDRHTRWSDHWDACDVGRVRHPHPDPITGCGAVHDKRARGLRWLNIATQQSSEVSVAARRFWPACSHITPTFNWPNPNDQNPSSFSVRATMTSTTGSTFQSRPPLLLEKSTTYLERPDSARRMQRDPRWSPTDRHIAGPGRAGHSNWKFSKQNGLEDLPARMASPRRARCALSGHNVDVHPSITYVVACTRRFCETLDPINGQEGMSFLLFESLIADPAKVLMALQVELGLIVHKPASIGRVNASAPTETIGPDIVAHLRSMLRPEAEAIAGFIPEVALSGRPWPRHGTVYLSACASSNNDQTASDPDPSPIQLFSSLARVRSKNTPVCPDGL